MTTIEPLASLPLHRSRVRASDLAYEALVEAIRHLRLPPGSALSENDLAARLNVSRTPVREAIGRLVEAGLVQVLPQVGTRVSPIAVVEVAEAQFIRESLEVAVVEQTCLRPDRDVSQLRELLAEQEAACESGDFDSFFAADDALHQQIFTLAGHHGAWQVVQRSKLQLDRLRHLNQTNTATVRELIADHTAIVDALEAGAGPDGRLAVHRHARRAIDRAPALQAAHPDFFTPGQGA